MRHNLQNLLLRDFDSDITKLKQITTLWARGPVDKNKIGFALISAYKTAKNDTFLQQMNRSQDQKIPQWQTLMQIAEQRYQELLDTSKWNTPGSKKLIRALTVETKSLKQEAHKKKTRIYQKEA